MCNVLIVFAQLTMRWLERVKFEVLHLTSLMAFHSASLPLVRRRMLLFATQLKLVSCWSPNFLHLCTAFAACALTSFPVPIVVLYTPKNFC